MKMTSTKRFAVRTTLVTGTTLATIVGAHALASFDEAAISKTPPAIVAPVNLATQSTGNSPIIQPSAEVSAAAPDIVILRHAGQAPNVSSTVPQASVGVTNPQPVTIQPPNPVQVAVPQPVPQQSAPVVATTRSSR
jgi:hypothetical protein